MYAAQTSRIAAVIAQAAFAAGRPLSAAWLLETPKAHLHGACTNLGSQAGIGFLDPAGGSMGARVM